MVLTCKVRHTQPRHRGANGAVLDCTLGLSTYLMERSWSGCGTVAFTEVDAGGALVSAGEGVVQRWWTGTRALLER